MSRRLSRSGAGLLCACMLTACGSGMSDLELYVADVKNRKPTQIEPIPQMKQYEAFAYEPGDRRDPFVPVEPQRDQKAADGPRPDLNRNKEPLEEYPLDGLRMQGTIRYQNKVYALVKAPDNVVHRVTVGNHLGQNYGQIKQISESEIAIAEIVPDGFGGYMARPATLALAE